jgi:hypothetical protein
MKNVLFALALTFLVVATHPTRAGDESPKESSLWMKQKLKASQTILAALANADFEAIERNAQTMILMDYLEKALRQDMPGYRTQLRLFEFADRELIRAAGEKNIDAATLAFTQLTISCVNCHKIVREAGKSGGDR